MGMINTADILDRNRPASAADAASTEAGLTRCSAHQTQPADRRKKRDTPVSVVTRRPWANAVGLKAYKINETYPPIVPNSRADHQKTSPPSATLKSMIITRAWYSMASGSLPTR